MASPSTPTAPTCPPCSATCDSFSGYKGGQIRLLGASQGAAHRQLVEVAAVRRPLRDGQLRLLASGGGQLQPQVLALVLLLQDGVVPAQEPVGPSGGARRLDGAP